MNRLKNIIFILIFTFCCGFVEFAAAFEQMKTYTVADGLVGPIVPVIFQDSRGVLWFGSDRSGISRFDGNTFVPYSGDSEVLRGRTKNIVEDKWGHIWFLSKHPSEGIGVISRYNGITFEFEQIGEGNCIAVDNEGDVWVGGNNTVTRFTSENNQDIPQPIQISISGPSVSKINVIFQSREGTFWIGGNDAQGVLIMRFQHDRDTFQTGNLQRMDSLPNLPKDRAVQVIVQDQDNNLWFGGQSLLLRYDGTQFEAVLNTSTGSGRQVGTPQTPNFAGNGNVSVKSDKHGRIWFSDNKQLSWWDGKSLQRLRNFTLEANPNSSLQGSFEIEDAWDKLWFASETGAHHYENKYFEQDTADIFQLESPLTDSPELAPRVYRVDDGIGSDNILTIFEAMDGKIWFGHDNGVTSFEPQPVIVNHTTRANLGSNSVRMMSTDSTGTLWLTIPGGVARYDAKADKLIEFPLGRSAVQNESSKVEIKIGNQRQNRRTDIMNIFEADGYIWFLDRPIQNQDPYTLYRIFRYRNGEFENLSLQIRADMGPGGETNYNDSKTHVSSGTNPWITLGGWVFLPRSNGLHRLLPDGEIRIFAFDTTQSLPSPTAAVTALHSDSKNRLWCYFETGEVKRYTNIRVQGKQVGGDIHVEVLPLRSVVPVLGISEGKTVKWFYNVVSGQLMYWQNPDLGNTPTELPGAASGPPLLTVQTSTVAAEMQNGNTTDTPQKSLELITFVFQDGIKTYQGTELKHAVSVELNKVNGAITSSDGDLWLATSQGVIRYDGVDVTTYTIADGFLVDDLRDVHEDHWGNLWFATWGGGVVRYDGDSFQSVTTKDGLIHNNVSSIQASNEKDLWFATEGGATQYRPSLGALPFCRIVSVDAGKSFTEPFMVESGKRTFTEIEELLPARIKDLTIHFQGISPLRDDVEYKFRLIGVDNNAWTSVSSDKKRLDETTLKGDVKQYYQPQEVGASKSLPQIRYEGLKSGNYTFLIKAFREGWPYTQQPAVLNFTIDQPIWSRWRNYLPTLIFIAAVGSLLFRLIVNRKHTAQLRLEMREKEEADMQRIRAELNEAQNIQMGLLPDEAPHTQDFDIAGKSMPATQVGGDFFDYLTVANGQTAIAVADAAGKGIRGAMNAVLTNGMLHEIARFKSDADIILSDLNAGLAPRMYGPSFIALNLAVLNEVDKQVDYANGGQPYPILKRGSEIIEIENSDLPLGGMKGVQYESVTLDLEEGDFFIFHSDGLIEALNAEHDMYGTERFIELASNIPQECTAEEVIQRIIDDVQDFVQEAEQYDDLTLVVIKRLPASD